MFNMADKATMDEEVREVCRSTVASALTNELGRVMRDIRVSTVISDVQILVPESCAGELIGDVNLFPCVAIHPSPLGGSQQRVQFNPVNCPRTKTSEDPSLLCVTSTNVPFMRNC